MPGVLIIEALAQVGAVAILSSLEENKRENCFVWAELKKRGSKAKFVQAMCWKWGNRNYPPKRSGWNWQRCGKSRRKNCSESRIDFCDYAVLKRQKKA